jgi:hypothetical protein
VSASPEEIVKPLGTYLGVDRVIASRAMVDDDGRYTGEMAYYAYGPNKAVAIREFAEAEGIDLAESYAYSDSASDIPMLEVVGHAVAVNPDRELLKAARERDWEVRRFVHPVRLRDRVPVPPPGPSAAVAGALAATAGGVALWRWRRKLAAPPPPKWRARLPTKLAPSWPRRLRGQ